MRFNHRFIDSLLVHGIAAAKVDETRAAQRYFDRILHLPATHYQRQKALYWLSEVVEESIQVREYLEEILIVNPGHRLAKRKPAIIDGRLKEIEIIDANQYETEIPAEPKDAMGKRFVCPNCGGRMVFTPQGDDLICKYCRYTPSVQGDENDVQEQDFIIGMATAKGHNSAVTTKAFDCAACGATYLLSPETLSLTCAYCDSSYTIRSITERKIIPPEGIIPFAITRSRAEDALREKVAVMAENSRIRLEEMQGVYLPVWTFDVRGEVPYTHEDQFTSQISNSTVSVSLDDLLVPASKPLPKSFKKMMPFYNIEKIVSYDPKYLSNWLAETYQIKLSDAALTARAIAVEQTKQEIKNDAIYKISKIKIKSAHLFIHSYKLILLPLWIGQYRLDGKRYEVIINGQSSEVMNDLILEKLSGFKH